MAPLATKFGQKAREDERGITLIELLVVVIIIGIPAVIAIPTYLNQREESYNADAKVKSHNATTAAVAYLVENGDYNGITVEKLKIMESSLPSSANVAPYNGTGKYTVTVIDSGKDFQLDVGHSGGSETYRSSDAVSITLP